MRMPMDHSFAIDRAREEIEILVDRWGIPHIYAGSLSDAFFGQGFNAARTRLWQIDTWRRAGLGRLAEVLGGRYVERDRSARLLRYRGRCDDQEWLRYGDNAYLAARAFVDGVNEYVAAARTNPGLLPSEFAALGYMPSLWSPDDLLEIRALARYRNARSEAARAKLRHAIGSAADRLRCKLEPHVEPTVAEGVSFAVFAEDVLRAYNLAADWSGEHAPATGARDGSNNWAVAGERTDTGRPILANDPHRALTVPSLRYLSHLECPGLHLSGAGEPHQPGVVLGHTDRMAFGITISPVDQEDLYVYELDRVGGHRYRYDGGWEEMHVETETIPVLEGEAVEIRLPFTRHGPVLHHGRADPVAVGLRAGWLEPGMAPYLGSLGLIFADAAETVREVAERWGAPAENICYASAGGEIGWVPAGMVPIRPNWNGLLPVPGDGRYEWSGFEPLAATGGESNPERGWVATANALNLSPERIRAKAIGFEWEPAFRQQRIDEVLADSAKHTVTGSLALQTDYTSLTARPLRAAVARARFADRAAAWAARLLADWDGVLSAHSSAAALFEFWLNEHLRPALLRSALVELVPAADVDQALAVLLPESAAMNDNRVILDLVEQHADGHRLGELFESTLAAAVSELMRTLGRDPAGWTWGDLHGAVFAHTLGLDGSVPTRIPRGGDGDTVGCTALTSEGFEQSWGASARVVIDVGAWDQSRAVNAPGQDGNVESLHAADLVEVWAADGSIPMLFGRAAIESGLDHRITLRPRGRVLHTSDRIRPDGY